MGIKLFLGGDVMTGRGIDQVLPHPCPPEIHESYLRSALDYVKLAEQRSGPIPRRVAPGYIWGDALQELERRRPDARIINLETAITTSNHWEPKGINYRMNPRNISCLEAARIDCCALANNHVLDWGATGLAETLHTLHAHGIRTAGAGLSAAEALAPAEIPLARGGRILVFGFGSPTGGVPEAWAAGVSLLPDLSRESARRITERIRWIRKPGDLVVASIHWGSNWGFEIPHAQREFARTLVELGVDLVHGHSSHHVKGMEVHQRKLILYGCGDLITDYEGITGYERYRGDLGLMYFPELSRHTGELLSLAVVPMRMCRFRLTRASEQDAQWLSELLRRDSLGLGEVHPLQAQVA